MMARTSSGHVSSGKDRAFFNWRYIRGKYERRREHRLAFILLWSILLAFLFRTFVVTVGVVNDTSMHPALGEGGYYLVNKYIYHFARPQRGDIVVFRVGQYDTEEQVKRIIGLPGETLQITSGEVYINGRRLDEPYAVGATYPDFGPTTVEEALLLRPRGHAMGAGGQPRFWRCPAEEHRGQGETGRVFPIPLNDPDTPPKGTSLT